MATRADSEGHHYLELVAGELIDTRGKSWPHSVCRTLTTVGLAHAFGSHLVVSNCPINVAPEDNPWNEPEPDVVVFKREFWTFMTEHPRPDDLHLVVEVADSSLTFDLTTKAALYARAAIVEYWVLDIVKRQMIVHRDPTGGMYAAVSVYRENEAVSPLAAPHVEFRPADVFPR